MLLNFIKTTFYLHDPSLKPQITITPHGPQKTHRLLLEILVIFWWLLRIRHNKSYQSEQPNNKRMALKAALTILKMFPPSTIRRCINCVFWMHLLCFHFTLICPLPQTKNMLYGCIPFASISLKNMGQFLQDGKYSCFASLFFKVGRSCDWTW